MKYYTLLFITLLLAGSCKKTTDNLNDVPKNNCADCFYYNLIDTLAASPQFDSVSLSHQLKGVWGLQAASLSTKNAFRSLIFKDSIPFNIHLEINDSTYTFFQNDSLITMCNYSISSDGIMNGNGCGFYYGKLYNSEVRHKNNYIGIGSVFPSMGSYFLVFQKLQ